MKTLKKFLTWIVLAPAAVIVIAFAIANRHQVDVNLDPLPLTLVAPLYVVVMLAILVGLVIGGWGAWQRGSKWRRRAREQSRQAARLSGELQQAQEGATTAVVPAGATSLRG